GVDTPLEAQHVVFEDQGRVLPARRGHHLLKQHDLGLPGAELGGLAGEPARHLRRGKGGRDLPRCAPEQLLHRHRQPGPHSAPRGQVASLPLAIISAQPPRWMAPKLSPRKSTAVTAALAGRKAVKTPATPAGTRFSPLHQSSRHSTLAVSAWKSSRP